MFFFSFFWAMVINLFYFQAFGKFRIACELCSNCRKYATLSANWVKACKLYTSTHTHIHTYVCVYMCVRACVFVQGSLTTGGRLSTVYLLVLTGLDPFFFIDSIVYLFCKTRYLNEEVYCTDPSQLTSSQRCVCQVIFM